MYGTISFCSSPACTVFEFVYKWKVSVTQENDTHSLCNGNHLFYRYCRFQLAVIEGDSKEKVNIFGGDSLGNCEKEIRIIICLIVNGH